ncbi:MAG: cryptochrome/photolyase family protein [Candidatus Eremiobacteraeota bacterium]|nr:cryptochrome/photolyase family protein [Candidatus Eremiobacteraeota bacterium]
MSDFIQALRQHRPDPDGRRWLYVPYDQLSDEIGPLAREPARELGLVLIENPGKAARRPYHRQKLANILANQRHFALEQARRGVAVRYLVAQDSYAQALESVSELGPLRVMEPAERELRQELAPLFSSGLLEQIPHEGWLTTADQFKKSQKSGGFKMDAFYRKVRQDTGILMRDGSPIGEKYSHDADNRESWAGEPAAPEPPTYELDDIKREVGRLIEAHFSHHPGRLDLKRLPATKDEAAFLWEWAKKHCMKNFGPYEDAMSWRSRGVFHTRVSPLLNIHRLLPRTLVDDALQLDIPLSSMEGFIRQVIGWREYVRHVHRETDGFRTLDGKATRRGDGGYALWAGQDWPGQPPEEQAEPNFFGADNPLPPAYWGKPSGLACLDQVVDDVWYEGWSHHITRLMILSNLATLLDISPRQLTDWFWVAYIDAFDWVVEPNVLGMGTYAVGELMTTKPYISGAAYINRMSDYCDKCSFNPKKNCPITRLYWAFLGRHAERLEGNFRLAMPLRSLAKRSAANKAKDAETFEWVIDTLTGGGRLEPS